MQQNANVDEEMNAKTDPKNRLQFIPKSLSGGPWELPGSSLDVPGGSRGAPRGVPGPSRDERKKSLNFPGVPGAVLGPFWSPKKTVRANPNCFFGAKNARTAKNGARAHLSSDDFLQARFQHRFWSHFGTKNQRFFDTFLYVFLVEFLASFSYIFS